MKLNKEITIEQKIEVEAVEYAIKIKSNYLAAVKYGVSEQTIRYWRSEIDKLKKASKTKITIHKGPPISEATLNTDLKLLEFYETNRKLKKPNFYIFFENRIINIQTYLDQI